MEKMQQFDELIKKDKDYSYYQLMFRFMTGIFLFTGSLMFLIPYESIEWKEDWKPILIPVFFLAIAVWYYMAPLLQVGNEQQKTAIYELLRYTPVSRQKIRYNRMKIMLRFVGKVTGVILVMQLVMSIIMHAGIRLENILYPAVIGLWLVVNGSLQILLSTSK